ncbi:hypothetical protein CSC70_00325 [Pseudoxanthomonas kalamensis DSM 18571]|uniref:septal ring lytic transglycosylase RlpA family protein n=1 Tax=Pseudoxanthomonas kalamensis TaxID=289483 RepID=UPI0013912AB7|nr:septal ring lytic transglycosylase RlpA family protein [Pseudoxanthomonas kalamensis]KAF1712020.1 hypothetical protein CSC70_00325 [Pseudoxanthomonas kalamensis DSM 18571]
MKRLLPLLLLALAACGTAPKKSDSAAGTVVGASPAVAQDCIGKYRPAQEDASKRGNYTAGGLYAPGVRDSTPDYIPDVNCIAEPVVGNEPRSPVGNRSPYTVLGKKYRVLDDADGYVERGTASYYGNKFHGRRTSNQEVYDMYAFTAAHKTLPLPSFARVTNLDNGKSVVVRVNDRGPFHEGRVIDLSYAAAVKLDIVQRGTGRVEVRALKPGDQDAPKRAAAKPASIEHASVSSASGSVAAPMPTAMDRLVQQLPAAPAPASLSPSSPAPIRSAPAGQAQAGTLTNADQFDAWMQANGIRVATGKPAQSYSDRFGDAPAAADASTTSALPPTTPATPVPPPSSAVQLQVGSFSSRDNAERALQRLQAAGIADAGLSEAQSNGRTLWRLRVPAADAGSAASLAERIAALGLGQPQLVRE